MKALVVYDSAYGNTEEIAKAIGGALGGQVLVRRANEVSPSDLASIELLIVGSPTQAGKPTQAIQDFLKSLPDIRGVSVAAFDSRMSMWLARVFGYAAQKIVKSLKARGGTLVAPPQAFYVDAKEGPLADGEAERAAYWARTTSGIRASGKD